MKNLSIVMIYYCVENGVYTIVMEEKERRVL
jgi:hypothetical protein